MLPHILDHEHHRLHREQRDPHPLEVLTGILRSYIFTGSLPTLPDSTSIG